MEDQKSDSTAARPAPEELKELLDEQPSSGAAAKGNPGGENSPDSRSLEFLYDVPLQVSVEVGRSKLLLRDLLKMGEGYVIELDKLAGEPLDLYVNSRLIARGEAVMVGDKFGIRLTDVVSTKARLEKLG
ncbi:flagellar motor switch protein FliN [Desulfofustis glycolicus]|uniref:Flagellar motor switch protein FliN n=1 Tax=Desulfofustis glycolicus DSM 9705 TaxID=1121409 RepID=A0A1M5U1P9_9BACT|nr:flagellar motor switch protein FliN [Desulfofustis glycolicus]MCB2214712.1 flagellar motor switch protein FliN [Desulfobulbaceae bacterium]SHH56776.1 flagellar motor switch protein FliN/FliY [Desulfofustis glycolicus DSM 9705]